MNTQVAILARSIASALMVFADSIQHQCAKVESSAPIVTAQAEPQIMPSVGVSTTTLPEPTNSGLTVVDALEQGLALTGKELDANGVPWIKEINTNKPAVTAKNIWKRGKGVDEEVYKNTIAEYKAKFADGVIDTPAPTVMPLPSSPNVSTGVPLPTSAPVDEHAAIKKEILAEVNKLTSEFEVDYEVIQEFFADDFNASDRTFATVSTDDYPEVHKALVSWSECLKLIASATVDCLNLNGNDRSVIIEHIYTGGQFGCTDSTLVHKSETWRLYEALAAYRTMLENHFQKPVTPLAVNPYL